MIYHGVILVDVMFKMRVRPLGAYRIANMLRNVGYNILVVDMYCTLSIDELKEILAATISKDTLFFGYSSTMFSASKQYSSPLMAYEHDSEPGIPTSREYFIETNAYVKSLNPNIKTMYGGACTMQMRRILEDDPRDFFLDYLVEGYCEGIIAEVVNNIRDNIPQKVSGKINNTEIINWDQRGSLFDFRNHKHLWHESDLIMDGEVLPIEVARGCIFRCKFCSFPLIGKRKDDLSYLRTEENLIEEIVRNYENHKTTKYSIVDDTFNERNDKILMMLKARDKAKVDLEFSAYIRLDLVAARPEQIEMLRDLNVNIQYYGIETLTEQSAKAIGKPGQPEKLLETIHKMHEAFKGKVSMHSGHIIGLPHETRETVEESIRRLIGSELSSVMFLPLWLGQSAYGESELLKNPEKYGYRHIGNGEWETDYWTHDDAVEVVMKHTELNHDSGRTKLSLMEITGMLNLGYEFKDVYNIPVKEFTQGYLREETTRKHLEYRAKYLNSLRKYLGIS